MGRQLKNVQNTALFIFKHSSKINTKKKLFSFGIMMNGTIIIG